MAIAARGDRLIVSMDDIVELWDATTLRPRLRVYDGSTLPIVWPPVYGMAVWIGVFAFRVTQGRSRTRHVRDIYLPPDKNAETSITALPRQLL